MAAVAAEFDKRENRTGTNAPTFQFMRTGYFCMDNRALHSRPPGL